MYPKTDGTSIRNTRFTIDFTDNDGSTGYVATNFYGTGGTANR